ncbi:metalloendoproteinase 1 [Trifolium medium]|uniref:Metalloendoproteinase 1 n=1 Tax=Trifolium medium TaxID=97028 RepID=A0A392ML30_9FABA|nr:metalloendoproteinase 1 [Trifolium medium]
MKKLPSLPELPRKPNGRTDFGKPIVIAKETVNVAADYSLDLALENLQSYDFLDSSVSQPNSPDKLDINTYLRFAVVMTIQQNFNLPITGNLDDLNTINIITKPRCDFPDKIHGTSTLTKLANNQISLKPWWRNVKKNELSICFWQ